MLEYAWNTIMVIIFLALLFFGGTALVLALGTGGLIAIIILGIFVIIKGG